MLNFPRRFYGRPPHQQQHSSVLGRIWWITTTKLFEASINTCAHPFMNLIPVRRCLSDLHTCLQHRQSPKIHARNLASNVPKNRPRSIHSWRVLPLPVAIVIHGRAKRLADPDVQQHMLCLSPRKSKEVTDGFQGKCHPSASTPKQTSEWTEAQLARLASRF
jgi:hypothetical protein